jgi:predicted acyl esterase
MAAVVGASGASAAPIPPKITEKANSLAAPAPLPEPAPAVPTFVNGLAQTVFSTDRSTFIQGQVWVESTFDSDGDGKLDRMHADYVLPRETQTDGLKVPVIYEDSPYFANTAPAYSNWSVAHELGAQPPARAFAPPWTGRDTAAPVPANDPTYISNDFENQWVPRGFGVVHSESPGTGWSTGCPTSGGRNETLGATAIIDWLNGRAKAYTSRDGNTEAPLPTWTTGKVGMMGTSYNGTIPEAAATTGVQGLEAIVPISAISDWYDYYRANGQVRAPHSAAGGTGTNTFLGEDLDVLVDDVYSRLDEGNQHLICRQKMADIGVAEDRLSGNRSAFWDERNYMKDVNNVHAAALIAHGNNDFNVMTKNAAQFLDALKRNNVPHQFYFHQRGHGGAPPDVMINRWFTRYLYGVQNGVENMPKSWVEREAATCPARQATVTGDQSNTATLTVSSSAPFQLGFTLTIPRTNATGTVTNVAQVITNIPDATHITVANAVATGAGEKVAGGATVVMLCQSPPGTPNNQTYINPTPYAEWPDPTSAPVTEMLTTGGNSLGGLSLGASSTAQETLTDDAAQSDTVLLGAATSPNRLVYQSNVLNNDIRISGTPSVNLRMAFSKPRANLSAALISYPATGTTGGVILTRGWLDPENRNSDYVSDAVTPGTFYNLHFDMQAKDAIVPAGRRLALMVFSSDRNYDIRPAAGTQLTLDLAGSSFTIPIVGGRSALAAATGAADGTVGGTVPATLSLTLGTPASFGAFTPGIGKTYAAQTSANVISTAGDALLSVADPSSTATGHLVNGSFSLPEPLQARGTKAGTTGTAFNNVGSSASPLNLLTWNAPVSNDAVTLEFSQKINANDALRTGTYSKTLTFTLSTTTP